MEVEAHLSPPRMFERVCVRQAASAARGALLRSPRLQESPAWPLGAPRGGRGRDTPAGRWRRAGPGPVDWGMRGKMRGRMWGWTGPGRRPRAKEGKAGAGSGGGGPAHWRSGLGETPNVPR